jgi:hypothetical protein
VGLLDRWRTPPEPPWQPPAPGGCACDRHVEELAETVIAWSAGSGRDGGSRVADLVADGAFPVRAAHPSEREVRLPTGQLTRPYHWVVLSSPDLAALHDGDAPVHLDDCLSVQPGVDRVAVLAAEVEHALPARLVLGAPTLCPSGVRAALVLALGNPRVRRTSSPPSRPA